MTCPKFYISSPSQSIIASLQQAVDQKTKPAGSLGRLEEIALKIGLVQQTVTPKLVRPQILVFAGDHGITEEGVSAYPQEVTHQMVRNFLEGGAAINVFTRQHAIELTVVDSGINHDFGAINHPCFRDEKIAFGTRNFLEGPAMSREECFEALQKGAQIVEDIFEKGTNVIGFGEMGIGNTSAASLLMAALTGIPVADCTGRGTGIDEKGLNRKQELLGKALKNMNKMFGEEMTPVGSLQYTGGFEMAMMCGAMLKAAERKMLVLVDGFIASSVFLCASKWYPEIMHYAVFCHRSEERGHAKLLDELDANPLLELDMRLGEGTGCAVVYPILESAVLFLNEMASFSEAKIEQKK